MLSLAVQTLAVPIPAEVLRDLAPTSLDPEILSLLDEEIWGGDPYSEGLSGGNMAIILTQGTLRSRLALIRDRLFPPREEIAALDGAPTAGCRLYVPLFVSPCRLGPARCLVDGFRGMEGTPVDRRNLANWQETSGQEHCPRPDPRRSCSLRSASLSERRSRRGSGDTIPNSGVPGGSGDTMGFRGHHT